MATKKEIPALQIVIFLVLVVAAVYVVKTYILKPKDDKPKDDTPPVSGGGSSSSKETPKTPPVSSSGLPVKGNDTVLKRGDKAVEVKYIQHEYNTKFVKNQDLEKLVVDGIFGEKTEKAVKLFTGKTSASYSEFMKALNEHLDKSFTATWNNSLPSWMQF